MENRQRRTLDTFGYAIMDLPNLKTIPHMDFVTQDGRILRGLPADAYHLKRYLARGFKPVKVGNEQEILEGDNNGIS